MVSYVVSAVTSSSCPDLFLRYMHVAILLHVTIIAMQEALRTFDFETERKWIWAGVGFDIGFTLVMVACSTLALIYLNGEEKMQWHSNGNGDATPR